MEEGLVGFAAADLAAADGRTTSNRRTSLTGALQPQWIDTVYLPLTAESKKLALLAGFYDEDAANDDDS